MSRSMNFLQRALVFSTIRRRIALLRHTLVILVSLTGLLCTPSALKGQQRIRVDPELPDYVPSDRIEGRLRAMGSDTMLNVMALWAEAMQRAHPAVNFEIEGKGTSTGPPALVSGLVDLGLNDEPWRDDQIEAFRDKFGYEPTIVPVFVQVLVVIVHKDNPIESLTLPQVEAIFSKEPRRGAEPITTWGQLGFTGVGADLRIRAHGRTSASGTHRFFSQRALGGRLFRETVTEHPGSTATVAAVAADRAAIGYVAAGYLNDQVRAVPLSVNLADKPVLYDPNLGAVGTYPLARYLYIALNVSRARNLRLPPGNL